MSPTELEENVSKLFPGCMQGRTMYMIPFRWISSSPQHKMMDSAYMAVSMMIMTMISILTVWDRLALRWQRLGSS